VQKYRSATGPSIAAPQDAGWAAGSRRLQSDPCRGERATRKRHPPAFGTGCPHATPRGGANGKQVRATAVSRQLSAISQDSLGLAESW